MSWSRLAFFSIAAPLLTAAPVLAQQPTPPASAQPAPPASVKPAPPVSTKSTAKPQPGKAQAAAQPAGETATLRNRVEQLEEQLVDLQVVIGTLESLAKTPAGTTAGAAGNDMARIQALEAQLKSLSGQIEQLGEKVRSAGEPSRRSENYVPSATQPTAPPGSTPSGPGPRAAASGPPVAGAAAEPPAPEFQPGQRLPPVGASADQSGPPPDTASYGSATVTSSQADEATAGAPPSSPLQQQPGADVAAIDPAGPAGGDPKHDYEVAYSYVIQRDYGAAQAGFTDFLKRHPKDALVPNALYWLGETHYQQRNFADASEAFDLVTKLYASSPKAADSQLKRALSLSALGKNNEACSALHDLDSKFQNVPVYVKTRAGSERRRLGCS